MVTASAAGSGVGTSSTVTARGPSNAEITAARITAVRSAELRVRSGDEHQLPGGLAGLQGGERLHDVGRRVPPADGDGELAVGDPGEDLVGAPAEFLGGRGVVRDRRPRDVQRAARVEAG